MLYSFKTTIQPAGIGTPQAHSSNTTTPTSRAPAPTASPDSDHYRRLALDTLRKPYLPTAPSKYFSKNPNSYHTNFNLYYFQEKLPYLHLRVPAFSLLDIIFFCIQTVCLYISNTPTNPPYKPGHLPAYVSQQKTLKSFPMYVPPSGYPCFFFLTFSLS